MSTFNFRPHHFLCALGFGGKGYDGPFIENFSRIMEVLRGPGGDDLPITVVADTRESICAACPNRRGEKCSTQAKVARLDRAHARALGLKPGDALTWGEAKARLAQNLTLEKHYEICRGCQWLELGVCGHALQKLQREHTPRPEEDT